MTVDVDGGSDPGLGPRTPRQAPCEFGAEAEALPPQPPAPPPIPPTPAGSEKVETLGLGGTDGRLRTGIKDC